MTELKPVEGWITLRQFGTNRQFYWSQTHKSLRWTTPTAGDDGSQGAGTGNDELRKHGGFAVDIPDFNVPEGWTAARDPVTGRVFYYNRDLKKSQWEHPLGPQRAVTESDWEALVDPESNVPYFYNQLEGKTQWDRPAVLGPPPEAKQALEQFKRQVR